MTESQSDLSGALVCNCPTIAGEKVKFAYCPVHGTDAAMGALNRRLVTEPIPAERDPRVEAAAETLAGDYAYLSQWEVTPAAWYQMARRALEAADHEGFEV